MTEVSAVQPMIHKFYLNGEYIVLDVNSGCVHLPDQLTYELLDTYDGTNPDEARAALGRIDRRRPFVRYNGSGVYRRA